MSASKAFAMFRPRVVRGQPVRVANVQQRFLNMQPTARLARPMPKEEHSAHTISQRIRTLKKIPPELIPLGVVIGFALAAAAYASVHKFYADKTLRLKRQGGAADPFIHFNNIPNYQSINQSTNPIKMRFSLISLFSLAALAIAMPTEQTQQVEQAPANAQDRCDRYGECYGGYGYGDGFDRDFGRDGGRGWGRDGGRDGGRDRGRDGGRGRY